MTCLKIQVPLPEKYVRTEPANYDVQRRRKQKVDFEIAYNCLEQDIVKNDIIYL